MDKKQAQETAVAAGLTRLEDAHLGQLARSVEAARELSDRLPKDLHWSEEIAPTIRLRRRARQ